MAKYSTKWSDLKKSQEGSKKDSDHIIFYCILFVVLVLALIMGTLDPNSPTQQYSRQVCEDVYGRDAQCR